MSFVQARILRHDVADFDRHPPPLSTRDEARRHRIKTLGLSLMARRGRHAIRMQDFAAALGHCTATIRRHFPDMDALLGEILRDHVQHIANVMGRVPQDSPCRQTAQRAAYVAATRNGYGGLTQAHLLLVRDRHLLPEDELTSIEATLRGLGQSLAGDRGAEALSLLDNPFFDAAQAEAMLSRLYAPAQPQAPSVQPAKQQKGPHPPGRASLRIVPPQPFPDTPGQKETGKETGNETLAGGARLGPAGPDPPSQDGSPALAPIERRNAANYP